MASGLAFGERLAFVEDARANLINNPESFPDVEVYSNESAIPILAHRAILASKSPVLKQFFRDCEKGKKTGSSRIKLQLEFGLDAVTAFVEVCYVNAAHLKLKYLESAIELAVCYGCRSFLDLCKSYCRYKTQKVIENELPGETNDGYNTSLSSYKPKPNPLTIVECAVCTMDPSFIKEILQELLHRIRPCHLTEASLVKVSYNTMRILLSSDELLLDELELIEFYVKWASLHRDPIQPMPSVGDIPRSGQT